MTANLIAHMHNIRNYTIRPSKRFPRSNRLYILQHGILDRFTLPSPPHTWCLQLIWPRLPVPSFLTPRPQTCPRPPFHLPPRRISTSSVPPQTRPASHILVYFPAENSMSAFTWRIVNWYLIKLGRHAVCWWVRIGLVQKRLDRGKDGRHVVCGGPAVLEDVQTNAPVSVHIRVEHFTHKPEKENVRNKVKTQTQVNHTLLWGVCWGTPQ